MSKNNEISDKWIEEIKAQLKDIQFGTLQVTIHSGNIVQIDRTIKHRYELSKPKTSQRNYN